MTIYDDVGNNDDGANDSGALGAANWDVEYTVVKSCIALDDGVCVQD